MALLDRLPSQVAHDALPLVGEAETRSDIRYAAACSGRGFCSTESSLRSALRPKTPSMRPEPWQRRALNSASGVMNLLDDQVQR